LESCSAADHESCAQYVSSSHIDLGTDACV
jgi:hypothetical protein